MPNMVNLMMMREMTMPSALLVSIVTKPYAMNVTMNRNNPLSILMMMMSIMMMNMMMIFIAYNYDLVNVNKLNNRIVLLLSS